jgi:5-methylcytosine-specific restriction endonuclease McrA
MTKINWAAVSDYYDAGHTRDECRKEFEISDWDWHAAVGRGEVSPRVKGGRGQASRRRGLVARLRGEGMSYSAIGRRLGISKSTVAYHARRLGIPADDRCARRYDWAEIQAAVDEGLALRECMKRFGFTRGSWAKAVKRGDVVPRQWITSMEELLVVGPRRGRGHIKARLLREGLKESRCEVCGLSEWLGKPLSLELHHINGRGNDNRLENLQLLCGNCHSQTDNWGGRGRKGGVSTEEEAALDLAV